MNYSNKLAFIKRRIFNKKCSNDNGNNDQYLKKPKPAKKTSTACH